jgi:hypothetical protein
VQLLDGCAPLARSRLGLGAAAAAGSLPFLGSWALRLGGHQIVSALLILPLGLALAREGRWRAGVLALALCYVSHCAVVIGLSAADPGRCAALLPGAHEYWLKQVSWIRLGIDPEYQAANWVPAHFQLLGATALYSYASLGLITLYQGFHEVDLMNYYVGRLAAASVHPGLALALGWHLWSVLRGLGYLLLTYELLSFALRRLAAVPSDRWNARGAALRAGAGLFLLAADGVTKAMLLEPVRSALFANLR